MKERLPPQARKHEDAHFEESALRRQLEGGLEELEAALERYRQLTSALGARRWKQKLQRHLLVAFWLYFYARSGSYWLTSERLIWQPRWSDPVEVRLSAIGEGNLRVGSAFNTVTVGERDGVALRHIPNATTLAALLSIRRRKEFRDAAASRDPRCLAAVLRMGPVAPGQHLDPESSYLWGSAVLRPDFIAYFRTGGARLLDAMTEPTGPTRGPSRLSRDEVPIPVERLLEQLLLLPEERMDAMLRKASNLEPRVFSARPDVFLWEARALKWQLRAFGSLKLYNGDQALFGYLSGSNSPVVEQLVARWKARRG